MKETTSKKKMLKIVAATSVTIFSLFAVFMGTYAWFTAKSASNAAADEFSIATKSTHFKKLWVYEPTAASASGYTFSSTEAGTVYFDSNGVLHKDFTASGVSSFEFEQYDMDNPYHPLMFRFELDQELTISDTERFSISAVTARDFWGVNGETLSSTSNPLSWIMSAYAVGVNTNSISYTYTRASLGTNVHFVDFEADGTGDIDYHAFHNSLTIYEPANGTTINNVIVIMDYYVDAISYIYNRNLGNEILDQERVPFFIDWVFKL